MIPPVERSPARDSALDAVVARVPREGWTMRALRGGLIDIGAAPGDAPLLFPGGPVDLIEAFIDLADRHMIAGAAALDLRSMRLPERVRTLIALRLSHQTSSKAAVRRAVSVLATPRHARVGARCTARTVDEIWHLAGDTATAFSWYTKRATLGAIYAATLLYWLQDASDDHTPTLAFLDRRLAGIARMGRARRRLVERFGDRR